MNETTYVATIEQHRRDYMGTIKRSPGYAEFDNLDDAKKWVDDFFHVFGGQMRFAVIDGPEGYHGSTGTDPMPGEWDEYRSGRIKDGEFDYS